MDVANDGVCSLIEAITAANTDTPSGATPGECAAGSGADTIVLATQATYSLSSIVSNTGLGANGLPVVTTAITIVGDGATIARDKGGAQFRIFQVSPTGSLTLDAVTVLFGRATDVYASGYGASGGCIRTQGPLHLKDSLVRQCTAGGGSGFSGGGYGGGVYAEGTTVTMERSAIEGCHAGNGDSEAGWGGGLFLTNTNATIADSRIDANEAGAAPLGFGGDGGGIVASGADVQIIRSSIHNNRAGSSTGVGGGSGGGIRGTLATIQLESSIITNNQAGAGRTVAGNGGGVFLTTSSLTTRYSAIRFNRTADGHTPDGSGSLVPGLPGTGGGLFLQASSLAMNGSVLSDNTTGNGGASVDISQNGRPGGGGAAIYAQGVGTVTLDSCVVADNTNGNGGDFLSIGSAGGTGGSGTIAATSQVATTIRDSVIRDNVAGNGGAASLGVGGQGGEAGGLLTTGVVRIERSSLTGNRAGNGGNGFTGATGGRGGAIVHTTNPLTLINVTISGNSAGDGGVSMQAGVTGGEGGSGGGLIIGSTASLYNVTISNNERGSGGAGMPTAGSPGFAGGIWVDSGTTTLRNTIVANSTGADCSKGSAVVSLVGPNLIEDNTCGATGGTDPRLASLANNGHKTLSHALCVSSGVPDVSCTGPSPALDAGDDSTCGGAEVASLDQRHAPRPAGSHCDLGSFESGASSPVAVAADVAARPGGRACVPVALGAASGPTSISNMISLPGELFILAGTTIQPGIGPSSPSGKSVGAIGIPGGSTLFTVSGGDAPLVPGLLYTANYELDPSTPTGSYPLTPTGGGSLLVTTCTGDCNANGVVSLGEVQRCVNHLLGAPLCNYDTGSNCPVVDANLNGEVSLGEVQQCVNRFLGMCP